jgi:ribosomal protein L11 methyltransferase
MDWVEIVVVVDDSDAAEGVSSAQIVGALLESVVGQVNVVYEQLGDPDDPQPYALLPETAVKGYVQEDRDSAEWRSEITTLLVQSGFSKPHFSILQQQDWANAWKAQYRPIKVGQRFWICPSWLPAPDHHADDILITLDPGMAFGTGTHPTTQLCLAMLEKLVHPQSSVLDLGCGTGILAIGAAQLGAAPVLAVDNDRDAVQASIENARTNQAEIDVELGTIERIGRKEWDIVVANILTPILIDMLDNDTLLNSVAPNGYLILSGILGEQEGEIASAIARADGVIEQVEHSGDWIVVVVTHANQ